MSQSLFYVIVGMGETGLSCARYFTLNQMPFAMMDTREHPPALSHFEKMFPNVPFSLGKLDQTLLAKADVIVLSPGISKQDPQLKNIINTKKVIGDVELFIEQARKPIVAITGTNAKSTVTTLVGEMLKTSLDVAVGGNIGIPVLDLLKENHDAYVLELSSFQLETTESLKAEVATVLNISADHMDRYQHLDDYIAAKKKVYQGAKCVVFNRDDPATNPISFHDKTLSFTLSTPKQNEFGIIESHNEEFLAFEETPLLKTTDLPVVGKHYQANALAALALGHAMKVSFANMINVLKKFPGLPHRCQFVRELNGVKWFNDSKGTNVGATVAAILGLAPTLKGKLILIAGGLGKSADFSPLTALIDQYVHHSVLIGQDAGEIAKIIKAKNTISYANDMQEAIKLAYDHAKPSDYVLLSPACASYDMFQNYAHRGDVFMSLVNQL